MARQLDAGPLRLAYQSFGQREGMEAYQEHLTQRLTASVSPAAEIRVLRLRSTLLEGKGFASAQALEIPALLQSVANAVETGCEAVAIGNGFDPGVWEARELFEVPVLGLFETVSLFALRAGWSVGVLVSGEQAVGRVEELAVRYGIRTRFVQPEAAGVAVPVIAAAFEDASGADAVIDAARRALGILRQRGAEVVIAASGILDTFLDVFGSRLPETGVPVLPAIPILARELEASAALARLGVPHVSRAGRFRHPPAAIRESLHGDV